MKNGELRMPMGADLRSLSFAQERRNDLKDGESFAMTKFDFIYSANISQSAK